MTNVYRIDEFSAFDDANDAEIKFDFRLPYGFAMRASGLWYTANGKDAVQVCQTFTPIARQTNEASEEPGTAIRWNDPNGVAHDWVVPDAMVQDDHGELIKTLALRHFKMELGMKPTIRLFFSKLVIARYITAYERAGWQGPGLFLLPNGQAYGAGADLATVTAKRPKLHQHNNSLLSWQDDVATMAVGNSRLVLALCAGLCGPLIQPAGEEFSITHFVGSSSVGKSTAAVFAASIWGKPTNDDQMRSWRGTSNGIEGVASECTDTLLTLDEMGQVDVRVIGECVYMLANGIGKARMSANTSMREAKTWRLSVISTGEITVEDAMRQAGKAVTGGIDVRMVNIPADAGAGMGMFEYLHGVAAPNLFANALKAAAQQSYGTAGPAFVEALAALRSTSKLDIEFRENLIARMRKFAAAHTPHEADGQVQRVIGKFALSAAAGELAVELGILPWDAGIAEAGVAQCLQAWLGNRQSVRPKEEETVISTLRDFIAEHGAARFEDRTSQDQGVVRDRAGLKKGEVYYFNTGIFKRLVAPMSVKAAVAILRSENLLAPNQQGDASTVIKENGPAGRYYGVHEDILK